MRKENGPKRGSVKKVLISGYYGFSNSGDDAVLASICRDIKNQGPHYEAKILSNEPEKTRLEYQVPSANRKNPFIVLKEIFTTDVVLLGGGSLLQDQTSTRSLMYYLLLLVLAFAARKKTILYANGIGPIHKPFNRKLVGMVVNQVDMITLREKLSLIELTNLGINKPEVHITSDPVFNLDVASKDLDGLFKKEGIPGAEPYVAIFFRTWGTETEYAKKTAVLCDYIVQKYNRNILFVPMKYPSDLNISNGILALMEERGRGYVVKHKYDSDTLINLIGGADFVISMRLHALLYAAIKAIPMIGFVYDPKVKYYLEELDMYGVEDLNSFDLDEVKGFIDEIMENHGMISEKIKVVAARQKAMAKQNIEYLVTLLER